MLLDYVAEATDSAALLDAALLDAAYGKAKDQDNLFFL